MLNICSIAFGGRGAAIQGFNFVTHYQNVTFGRANNYNYGPTALLDDDGIYKIWWTSNNSHDYDDTIWFSTSSDGIDWDSPSIAEMAAPYHELVADPSVIKINNLYYMYYTATSDLRNNGRNNEIFVSTSFDGINWTPYAQAVVPLLNPDPNGEAYGIGQPTVIYRDDLQLIQMWYTWTNGPNGAGLYYTESNNPLSFPISLNPNLATKVFWKNEPEIKYMDEYDKYLMIFEGTASDNHQYLLFNLSSDGIQWQQSSFDYNAFVETGSANPDPGQPCIIGDKRGWMIDTSFVIANKYALDGVDSEWQLVISSLDVYQIPTNAIYRFRNDTHHDRYYSNSPTNPNNYYTYEGMAFILYGANIPNTDNLYQLYNPNTIKHLYTSSWDEVQSATAYGFNYDGILGNIGMSYLEGSTFLYRLRHSSSNDYLYTTNSYEKNLAVLFYSYIEEGSPGYVLSPISQHGRSNDYCTVSISPTDKSFSSTGGNDSISVTCPSSNCPWVSYSNVSWITIIGGSTGTGNGTVSYTVSGNIGVARTGTINIAEHTFTVNQADGSSCYNYCQTQYVDNCVAGYYAQCEAMCGGNPNCMYPCINALAPQVNTVCTVSYCLDNVCQ